MSPSGREPLARKVIDPGDRRYPPPAQVSVRPDRGRMHIARVNSGNIRKLADNVKEVAD